MADAITDIQNQRTVDENSGIVQANHDAVWANAFKSPQEQADASANLDAKIASASQRKLQLQSQASTQDALNYARMMEVQARTQHSAEMAPLDVQLKQRQFEAAGATERRKAVEAQAEAVDTEGLNNGLLKIYQTTPRGTPEFQSQAAGLLAQYPHANIQHIAEVGKLAGFSDQLTPEQYVSEAVKIKNLAAQGGLTNPRVTPYAGRPIISEAAPVISPEQHLADRVATEKTLIAVRNDAKPPHQLTAEESGFVGKYKPPMAGVQAIQPILDKAGLNLDSQWGTTDTNGNWSGKGTPFQDAIDNKLITESEASAAAKAIGAFRAAAPKGTQGLQSHFDYVKSKMESLTTKQQEHSAPTPSSNSPKPPSVGEVRGGYKFKGGNPADRNNWEK